jgi:hypothetical protein
MIGTTTVARGTRGDYDPRRSPGDLTGRIAVQQAGAREDRDRAIKATRDALAGNEELATVAIPGGRTFALPKELLNFIRAEARAEAD